MRQVDNTVLLNKFSVVYIDERGRVAFLVSLSVMIPCAGSLVTRPPTELGMRLPSILITCPPFQPPLRSADPVAFVSYHQWLLGRRSRGATFRGLRTGATQGAVGRENHHYHQVMQLCAWRLNSICLPTWQSISSLSLSGRPSAIDTKPLWWLYYSLFDWFLLIII